MQPELNAQQERLQRLRDRQVQRLTLDHAEDRSAQQVRDKKRAERMKRIDLRFQDHQRFVREVMTIEAAPYLKLVAVLHREA